MARKQSSCRCTNKCDVCGSSRVPLLSIILLLCFIRAHSVHSRSPSHLRIGVSVARYPFSDTITFTVAMEGRASVRFPLLLRIPSWCSRATVSVVNGTPTVASPDKSGFARIDRTWKSGDSVVLVLPSNVVATKKATFGNGDQKRVFNPWTPWVSLSTVPVFAVLPSRLFLLLVLFHLSYAVILVAVARFSRHNASHNTALHNTVTYSLTHSLTQSPTRFRREKEGQNTTTGLPFCVVERGPLTFALPLEGGGSHGYAGLLGLLLCVRHKTKLCVKQARNCCVLQGLQVELCRSV